MIMECRIKFWWTSKNVILPLLSCSSFPILWRMKLEKCTFSSRSELHCILLKRTVRADERIQQHWIFWYCNREASKQAIIREESSFEKYLDDGVRIEFPSVVVGSRLQENWIFRQTFDEYLNSFPFKANGIADI